MTMQLTKNFTLEEWRCRDGAAVPPEYIANTQALASRLQKLRELLGEPITILSGYRTPSHNAKVGGAKASQHLTASAADIKVASFTPQQVATLYQGLINLGVVPDGGIGEYATWVHIDLGKPRRWNKETNE